MIDGQPTLILARVKAHAPLAVPYMQQTFDSSLGVAQVLRSVNAHLSIPQLRLLGGSLHIVVASPCSAASL